MSCLFAKAILGIGLGLLTRIDPALDALGLSVWDRAATAATAAFPFNTGTGFFVSADGHFVSAFHVLGDCPRPAVETPDGILTGNVVASSRADDLAVIKTDARPRDYARFPAYPAVPVWDPVTIARFRGCGGLASFALSGGFAASLAGRWPGVIAVQAAQPIQGGNSGSPVIDRNGAIVGMVVARLVQTTSTGIAVDVGAITRLLAEAGVPYEWTPSLLFLLPESYGAGAHRYTFPALCLY